MSVKGSRSSFAPSLGPVYELSRLKKARLERRSALTFWRSAQLLTFDHQARKMYSQDMRDSTDDPVVPEGIAPYYQEACTAMPQQLLQDGVA